MFPFRGVPLDVAAQLGEPIRAHQQHAALEGVAASGQGVKVHGYRCLPHALQARGCVPEEGVNQIPDEFRFASPFQIRQRAR
jgi:hypothetical protein